MKTGALWVAIIVLLLQGCGGDNHLPASNPPEYDPKKDYSPPTLPAAAPAFAPQSDKRSEESKSPLFELPPLEPGPNEKGEWRKLPVAPQSMQPLKDAKTVCDVLSKLVQGLGSAQLFSGADSGASRKSLSAQADSTAWSLDRLLFDTFKQQFGPGAGTCSTLTTSHNNGFEDLVNAARILRTSGPSRAPFQIAQTTVPEGEREGYTITKGSTKLDIPPEYVGHKTREWRKEVGTGRNAGNINAFTLVNGGKARKCPTPEGVVEGEYEFALIVHQTTDDAGTIRTLYNARRVFATLKGQVDDDAKLQYVDLDATLVIGRGVTDGPTLWSRQRQHVRFVPDHQSAGLPTQFSNWSISEWTSELVGASERDSMSMLLLAATVFSGPIYLDAELTWSRENTCVEITFNPVTKTQRFVPSKSFDVKTELRTKREQVIVPAKFKEARERPRERNGTVSPRQERSQPGAPAKFTYNAPPTRVRHSGFRVGAVSRAGVAEAKDGEWVLGEGAYVLEFQSRIVSSGLVDPAQSQAEGTIRLERQDEESSSAVPKYTGQGTISYQTGPLPNWNACDPLVRGQGTLPLRVFQAFIQIEEPRSGPETLSGGSAKVELLYGIPGTSQETSTGMHAMVNYECVPNRPELSPFWSPMFISGRGEVSTDPMVMFLLKDWTYVGQNGVVATKTLRSTCGGMCDQEVSVFTLKVQE
ncbi:MAG: hypothetical protein H8K04_18495 [Nitrospira sp.]